MSVTIADITLSIASSTTPTPEGHAVRFDSNGELVGLTLVRPKRLLERNGELRVTMPVPSAVPAAELTLALRA